MDVKKAMNSFLFSSDGSDYADEDDEPEMDLEMQMAFKEFIKDGGRKKD